MIDSALDDLKLEDSLDLIDTDTLVKALERRCKDMYLVYHPAIKDPQDKWDYKQHYFVEHNGEKMSHEDIDRVHGFVLRTIVASSRDQVEEQNDSG